MIRKKGVLPTGKRGKRKPKVSDILTATEVKRIRETATARQGQAAASATPAKRYPLNLFVTLHYDKLGIADERAYEATKSLIKSGRDFMRNNGGLPFRYVWVRENDYGDGSKGCHIHILLHLPNELSSKWNKAMRGYKTKLQEQFGCMGKRTKGALKSRAIASHLNSYLISPELYQRNLEKAVGYITKGEEAGKGGIVIGKRTGWSSPATPRQAKAPLQAKAAASAPANQVQAQAQAPRPAIAPMPKRFRQLLYSSRPLPILPILPLPILTIPVQSRKPKRNHHVPPLWNAP
jgi:hypothetical protein